MRVHVYIVHAEFQQSHLSTLVSASTRLRVTEHIGPEERHVQFSDLGGEEKEKHFLPLSKLGSLFEKFDYW